MTVLVTGSNGLVGSAIKEFLKEDVFFANRAHADLTNYEQTLDLFRQVKPTKVIHLAALVGGIGGNLMHSGDYFRNNLLINTNVLESARVNGVSRLISFMSTCVFPNEGPWPLNPKNLHDGPPHPSNFGYAYAKRMLEVQSRAYRAQWGLDYFVLIPTNIYGPHDNFNLQEGHVVPALIHKVKNAIENGTDVNIWGSGKPLREFVFSYDIAKLTIWMLDNYFGEDPVILSSGVENSIEQLTYEICEAMGYKGAIVKDSDKPDGQFRKPSDTKLLSQLHPHFEFTPLTEGIKFTVDWFQNSYPQIRK
jgi:GDP-L-fucose synthase